MTILLYKDGRLVIDDGNPIEGNSLEGLVACVSDPQSGDTLKFDGKQWVAGAAASGLPDVTGDDDGKVLTVVDGAWAPAAGGGGGSDVFIVNSLYDETIENDRLDKTAAEIVAALQAGKTMLVCRFSDSSYGTSTSFEANSYTCFCTFSSDDGGENYYLDISASSGRSSKYFSASSADAYPTYYDPD